MPPERWERIKVLVDAAVEIDGAERVHYLDSACGNDLDLRSDVDRLIRAYESAGEFLEVPLVTLSASQPALSEGQLLAGRYRIIRQLGQGGMGEVYEAQDEYENDIVALKTLRSEYASNVTLLQRFQREIKLARRVTHPNVCRIHEAGVHEFPGAARQPLRFFTMELLSGETLAQRLKRGPLKLTDAHPLIIQMAEALQEAHNKGVVHRDFKSANVMVCRAEHGLRAVITDFGLARPVYGGQSGSTPTMAPTTGLVGTPGYMSPEQMLGGEITKATDIYSFGVVLFEMASGKLPRDVGGAPLAATVGKAAWIRAAAPDIDPVWEAAIVRCLQPEPAHRFGSAQEIERHFRGDPWKIPVPRLTRRRAFGLSAAALVLAGLAGGYWYRNGRPYEPLPEARVWYEKGLEHLRATMFESARRALQKSVALDGNFALAHAYLAMALSELDDSERARTSALDATTALQEHRVAEVDRQRIRGLQLFANNDFQRAAPIFSELVLRADAAGKAAALLELARVSRRAEKFDDALEATAQAVKADKNSAAAWLLRAQMLQQAQDYDKAIEAYNKAEDLFTGASNHEGVAETLWQVGYFQVIRGQPEAAVKTLKRGLTIAEGTTDFVHQVRMELSLSYAFRVLGRMKESEDLAKHAVERAVESGNDLSAAAGLIDLGNDYLMKGEPLPAERYYKQGLEFAQRQKARYHESRARLSLASLCMQYGRSEEAMRYAATSLPYFREGKYRYELLLGLIILGNAQSQTGNYAEAAKNIAEAESGFDRPGDESPRSQARTALADVLMRKGVWREALMIEEQAIEYQRKAGLKLYLALSVMTRGKILGRFGLSDEAARDFAETNRLLSELPGGQGQLRAAVAIAEAELAYMQRRWNNVREHAQRALNEKGSEEDRLMAEGFKELVAARFRANQPISSPIEALAQTADSRGLSYIAARVRLARAEMLWETGKRESALKPASLALTFFEPRGILESIWRCQLMSSDGAAERSGRERLAARLSPEGYRTYLDRPDVQKLLLR